jgi:hypothetical protein
MTKTNARLAATVIGLALSLAGLSAEATVAAAARHDSLQAPRRA